MVQFIQYAQQDKDTIRDELIAGLLTQPASIAPKYLYDSLGSRLFEAICELPEYYPTRTEAAIFEAHGTAIANAAGHVSALIDLGAGNCAKAAHLFPLLKPKHYIPIDISVNFLRDSVTQLQQQFPQIEMTAIGMDFSLSLELPPSISRHHRLFFYPGSSIGNFTPQQAITFLQEVHKACKVDSHTNGAILIGVDLVKDRVILDYAYDDPLGVTAAFNLNLLQHLNRLIGADFNVCNWQHRGFFNPELSRVEMHLEAKCNLTVQWEGGGRRFERGECIHTESSYKYTPKSFLALLERAGFGRVSIWTDPDSWFMVCHAHAI